MKQQKKTLLAIILTAIASVAWATVAIATLRPLPAAATTGCTPCSVSKTPDPGDPNCAAITSCGLTGCKTVRGGSQYTYSNGIPACLKDKAENCYDVKCSVTAYLTRNCTGEEIDTTEIDRRGCKKVAAVPPNDPK